MPTAVAHENDLNTWSGDALPGTLIDELAEAVVWASDPVARSLVVCRIIEEISDTLNWLHGIDSDHAELASLRRLVEGARAHQDRMRANLQGLPPSDFNQATRFPVGCTVADPRREGS